MTHDAAYHPTPAMLAFLRDAATEAGADPWSQGSSTVGACKRAGFVVGRKVDRAKRYWLTDAGRAALVLLGETKA